MGVAAGRSGGGGGAPAYLPTALPTAPRRSSAGSSTSHLATWVRVGMWAGAEALALGGGGRRVGMV